MAVLTAGDSVSSVLACNFVFLSGFFLTVCISATSVFYIQDLLLSLCV